MTDQTIILNDNAAKNKAEQMLKNKLAHNAKAMHIAGVPDHKPTKIIIAVYSAVLIGICAWCAISTVFGS